MEDNNGKHVTHAHEEHDVHKHTNVDHHQHKTHQAYKVSTFILAGLSVLLLVGIILTLTLGGGKSTVKGEISIDTAKASVETYLKGISNGDASVDSITDTGSLYLAKITVSGKPYESYISKDGKLLFPQGIDMTEAPQTPSTDAQQESAPVDVPKTDKPKVEVFVMSHCPYGTQIEKGIIPVVKTLNGKMDFEIKFVNYAMHGEKELQEQLRQYCIQKNYNSKYMQYLSAFLEAGDSSKALSTIGITDADISTCVKDTDTKFKVTESFNDPQKTGWSGNFPPFDVYEAENIKYGVQGSPTLVINGKQVSSGRDAKSLLAAICNAYNNKPTECNTDMSSYGNPGAGFGFGTQGGSAQTAGCGA